MSLSVMFCVLPMEKIRPEILIVYNMISVYIIRGTTG